MTVNTRPPDSATVELLYAPHDVAVQIDIDFLSSRAPNSGCTPAATDFNAYPLLPNDPGVTGVNPEDFVPPFNVTGNDLFADGLETRV